MSMFIIKKYVHNYTQQIYNTTYMYSTCTKTYPKNRSIFMHVYKYILYPHIQP
jgi:hypothetical protein